MNASILSLPTRRVLRLSSAMFRISSLLLEIKPRINFISFLAPTVRSIVRVRGLIGIKIFQITPKHATFKICISAFLPILIFSFPTYADTLQNFVGRNLSELVEDPDFKTLTFLVHEVNSPKRNNEVLLQVPAEGSQLGTDRRVYLQVSKGLLVPDIRGLPKADAQEQLKAVGIGSAATSQRHPGVKKGIVATQIPEPGSRMDASLHIVFLNVSTSGKVEIPSIDYTEEGKIRKALAKHRLQPKFVYVSQNMGLYMGSYTCMYGSPFYFENPGHEYVTISPPSGTPVEVGTEVTITLTYQYYEPPDCKHDDAGQGGIIQ